MKPIHDIFILRNGVPIFHKRQDTKTEKIDDTLLMGFLSAITNFGEEIGLGKPFEYVTNEIKFSFYENEDLVYVVCCDQQLDKKFLNDLCRDIANEFVKHVPEVPSSHHLAKFDELVTGMIQTYDESFEKTREKRILKEKSSNYFKDMIPRSHYNGENLQFSGIRRELFKLINGKNSIYEISNKLTENPSKILNILRSYQKEGFISF